MIQVEALCTASHEASKLVEEVKFLRNSANERSILLGQVNELSAAVNESAASKMLLQGELAQAIGDLAGARDELQVCKSDLGRAQKQVRSGLVCAGRGEVWVLEVLPLKLEPIRSRKLCGVSCVLEFMHLPWGTLYQD